MLMHPAQQVPARTTEALPLGHALRRLLSPALALALALTVGAWPAWASDPWIDNVRAFEPGPSAGFGAAELPRIVLGPPRGLGASQGSVDVVSLGNGGRITVSFDDNAVVDGEGDDLVIFENPFWGGTLLFAELAFVEVSPDGVDWYAFPWDAGTWEGLAGREPVLANPANGMDPLDPASGGDRFDLADVGLDFVRFVRITDAGSLVDDPGNHSYAGTKGGFDLDAAAAIHSVDLGCIDGTVWDALGVPGGGARVVLRSAGRKLKARMSAADGSFRFCHLRPGIPYTVEARRRHVGRAEVPAFLQEGSADLRVDLLLPARQD